MGEWLRRSAAKPFPVIEIGAGTGALAKSVLDSVGFFGRLRGRYHIVEVSPILEKQQRETLRGKRVFWHRDMRAALDACGGEAQIISNELVDAFPCRVFVKSGGEWKELALELREGAIAEAFLALSPGEYPIGNFSFPDGQRIEVPSAYRDWLRSWISAWRSGNMLTVDYGGIFPQLYHRRPRGTLRGYFHHQRMEGAQLYQNFGRHDITADVNFSLLQQWGEEMGLKTVSLDTQRDFVSRMLGPKKVTAAKDPALRYLLQEPGPGDAFLALHQRRCSDMGEKNDTF
jgi:SAM-dependent MidA family methyltransferase